MRTRIALGAAAAAACMISSCIIPFVAAPADAGASSRPAGNAGHAAVLASSRKHDAPAARRSRHTVDDATFVRIVHRERALQFGRLMAAWRLAHVPPPAPPPVVVASPPPPPPPPPPVTDATSTTTADWACIRLHESSDRWNTPTVPGGAYGFLESTWLSLGYSGWPYQAPDWLQSKAALFLYNELGWQPWSTRFVCGL